MINMKYESGGHWYREDGTPEFDADLRRARKEGLLPSSTTILKTLPKPALDTWKQTQAILAALTLPRLEGEDLDSFAQRVVKDMNQATSVAANFGTNIHAEIERFCQTGMVEGGDF